MSVLPLLLALPLLAQGAQEPRSIERVAPNPALDPPLDDGVELFAAEFDRRAWRTLLAQPDLVRRQEAYEKLLLRARVDPVARGFLEVLAADTERTELAWTARLALRELGGARFPLLGADPSGALSPFGPTAGGAGLERMLEELLQEGRFGVQLPPPGGLLRGGGPGTVPGPEGLGRRRVEVHQTDESAVVEVVEQAGGEETRQRYEGETLEDLLLAHPDLERELGVSLRGLGRGRFHVRFYTTGAGAGEAWRPPFGVAAPSEPVRTDKLGVRVVPVTTEHADELGLEAGVGLYCLSTAPGTIAHVFGVRRGHVLLELNGIPLQRREDVAISLQARAPKQPIRLVWIDELGQRRQQSWTPPAERE